MKTLQRSFVYIVMILSTCIPTSLIAQQNNDVYTHSGFFLRFLSGGGAGSMVINNFGGSKLTAKSTGGLFHFQIGTEILENLVLFGDLGGFAISDPEFVHGRQSYTAENTEISNFGIGIGLSYYIMPVNVYLSGSILMAQGKFEQPGVEKETEWGPGILLCAGKEWWVGKKWGLGVAGFLEISFLKGKEAWGPPTDIRGQIFGIAFTATMY